MISLNQQERLQTPLEIKGCKKSRSRNALTSARNTSVLTLSRPIIRSNTPLTRTNTQRGGKSSLTAKEKSLINQNLQLKKENEKFEKLLKKAESHIKGEMTKYKLENRMLKKFVTTCWNWVESKVNTKMKEEVKSIVTKGSKGNCNNLVKYFKHIKEPIQSLKKKDEELLKLKKRLEEEENFNKAINTYIEFINNSKSQKEASTNKTIPVDSNNLIMDETDEVIDDYPKGTPIPAFLKTLRLA